MSCLFLLLQLTISTFEPAQSCNFKRLKVLIYLFPNFTNPEFKFQQFKVLQSGLFFLIKQVVLAFLSVF